MSGASAQLGDILHSDRVIVGTNGNVEWVGNPLECTSCERQFIDPITLSACQHSFCRTCLTPKDGGVRCPLCGLTSINQHPPLPIPDDVEPSTSAVQQAPASMDQLSVDQLIRFLIETTNEKSTACANCDNVFTPMYFCETCQQALCIECKTRTHQARMFASHRIVSVEERAVLHSNDQCHDHQQPYILFCTDEKQLKCIKCFRDAPPEARHSFLDLEKAHKLGCDKLSRVAGKLRKVQDDMNEQVAASHRFLDDLDGGSRAQRAHIQQMCQQMVDCLMQVRDRLIDNLDNERTASEQQVSGHLRRLYSCLPNLQLYLLSSSVLASSASLIDFLTFSYDLMRRMNSLGTELTSTSASKPDALPSLDQPVINCKDEFARALEPFLGISSILLPALPPDIDQQNGSAGMKHSRRRQARSGSGYVNCPSGWQPVSKYQMMVDLAGAFGEEFDKINAPIESFSGLLQVLSRRAQDMQRDMTVRRVIVPHEMVIDLAVDELMIECDDLEQRVQAHTILIQEVQPQLQQIWQEQLDRVQRQQQLCRSKVEHCVQLRADVQLVGSAVKHLRPFVASLATTAATFDSRRQAQSQAAQVAPMEMICKQIGQLEPDSTKRVDAIEKEEQQRRARAAAERESHLVQVQSLKTKLKTTKESRELTDDGTRPAHHNPRKQNRQAQLARLTARERSRGGTDHAMFASPLKHNKRSRSGQRSTGEPSSSSGMNTSADQVSSGTTDWSMMDATSSTECGSSVTSEQNSLDEETGRLSMSMLTMRSPCGSPKPLVNGIDPTMTPISLADIPLPPPPPLSPTEPPIRDDENAMKPPSGPSNRLTKGLQRSQTLKVEPTISTSVVVRQTSADGCDDVLMSSSLPTPCTLSGEQEVVQLDLTTTARPRSMISATCPTPTTAIVPAAPNVIVPCAPSSGAPPAGLWAAYRPGVTVPQSTLQAREEMLRMLKDRVPRIDVGALGSPSPERETADAEVPAVKPETEAPSEDKSSSLNISASESTTTS